LAIPVNLLNDRPSCGAVSNILWPVWARFLSHDRELGRLGLANSLKNFFCRIGSVEDKESNGSFLLTSFLVQPFEKRLKRGKSILTN
jgi:hypothetical protein